MKKRKFPFILIILLLLLVSSLSYNYVCTKKNIKIKSENDSLSIRNEELKTVILKQYDQINKQVNLSIEESVDSVEEIDKSVESFENIVTVEKKGEKPNKNKKKSNAKNSNDNIDYSSGDHFILEPIEK